MKKDTFCSFCGSKHLSEIYPKDCKNCQTITYINPLPVAVVLLPVDDELLVIRRNIPPIGRLALPGGFIEVGETWQKAGQRELFEETGIEITAEEIKLFNVKSAPDGTVLIFGLADNKTKDQITCTQNDETQEVAFIDSAVELGFPLHTEVVKKYFTR
ncbi:MAG: NUDIX domain-containing protein [Acidobacteriota bacterium]